MPLDEVPRQADRSSSQQVRRKPNIPTSPYTQRIRKLLHDHFGVTKFITLGDASWSASEEIEFRKKLAEACVEDHEREGSIVILTLQEAVVREGAAFTLGVICAGMMHSGNHVIVDFINTERCSVEVFGALQAVHEFHREQRTTEELRTLCLCSVDRIFHRLTRELGVFQVPMAPDRAWAMSVLTRH